MTGVFVFTETLYLTSVDIWLVLGIQSWLIDITIAKKNLLIS